MLYEFQLSTITGKSYKYEKVKSPATEAFLMNEFPSFGDTLSLQR
jgi:hypothetical protein